MPLPYTQHTWVTAEVISAAKLNNIEAGVQDLYNYVLNQNTTLTYSGRRLTQIDWPAGRLVFNYTSTQQHISTLSLQPAGGGAAINTWTPTYTGRTITAWTRT
jgi:hypothetical protein